MPKSGNEPTLILGYKPYNPKVRVRTIGRSYGHDGTGKTRLWLLAPKPCYVRSTDFGLEGTLDQLINSGDVEAKDVHVAEYAWTALKDNENSQDIAIALRDRMITDQTSALKAGARTILDDKESLTWEIWRYAEYGGPNSPDRKDYEVLNRKYEAFINEVKGYDCSLGLVQTVVPEWGPVGNSRGRLPGQFKPWGYENLKDVVMVNIQHRREKGAFYLDIGKCRQNTAIQDQTFEAGSFAELGTLLIKGTSEEDWR